VGHEGDESAQRRVEAHNFEIRKQLLEYDNVMNSRRSDLFATKRGAGRQNLKGSVAETMEEIAEDLVDVYASEKGPSLRSGISRGCRMPFPAISRQVDPSSLKHERMEKRAAEGMGREKAKDIYQKKKRVRRGDAPVPEKVIMLQRLTIIGKTTSLPSTS